MEGLWKTLDTGLHPPESRSFQVARWWRILLAMQETQVQSLGQEGPLGEEMATHTSILVWKFPGQRSLGGCSSWSLKESDTTKHAGPAESCLITPTNTTLRMDYIPNKTIINLTHKLNYYYSPTIYTIILSDNKYGRRPGGGGTFPHCW